MRSNELPPDAGRYSHVDREISSRRFSSEAPTLPGAPACPLHADLEAAIRRVESTVRRIDARQEQTDERLWDVLEGLVRDRPSQLAIVQAARPETTPPKRSISPARMAARQLGPWAISLSGVIGLALGLGLAAGWARACGYQVPTPAIPSAFPAPQ